MHAIPGIAFHTGLVGFTATAVKISIGIFYIKISAYVCLFYCGMRQLSNIDLFFIWCYSTFWILEISTLANGKS